MPSALRTTWSSRRPRNGSKEEGMQDKIRHFQRLILSPVFTYKILSSPGLGRKYMLCRSGWKPVYLAYSMPEVPEWPSAWCLHCQQQQTQHLRHSIGTAVPGQSLLVNLPWSCLQLRTGAGIISVFSLCLKWHLDTLTRLNNSMDKDYSLYLSCTLYTSDNLEI